MAKPSISIGVDDATLQPDNAPDGPYTTAQDEDARRRRPRRPQPGAARQDTRTSQVVEQGDLASRRKGPAQP